ncbi:MAG TPA: hypothetical protein V6C97_05765 [Oculatellaceae cyanobacterium]
MSKLVIIGSISLAAAAAYWFMYLPDICDPSRVQNLNQWLTDRELIWDDSSHQTKIRYKGKNPFNAFHAAMLSLRIKLFCSEVQ